VDQITLVILINRKASPKKFIQITNSTPVKLTLYL